MSGLIINADDAGLHPDIDRGIDACIKAGVVNSISIISNSPAVDHDLIRQWSEGGVKTGIHLSWLGVEWLTQQYFFFSWREFLTAYMLKGNAFKQEVYEEAKAQILAIQEMGISISHLDSHQHVHHFPGLWQMSVKLISEYHIPRIRCSKGFHPSFMRRDFSSYALQRFASLRFRDEMLPCAGLAYSGHYSRERLRREIDVIGDRPCEVIVHPGFNNVELNKHFGHWRFDWEQETDAVLHLAGSLPDHH